MGSVVLVSITAIVPGTSLPELFVSMRSIKDGEAELAIGNIFVSNAFKMNTTASPRAIFETKTLFIVAAFMQTQS